MTPDSQLGPSSPAQPHDGQNLTSSRTGTLYFAYGSNLSPEQMTMRCGAASPTSTVPIAVARLHGWRWIICQRGYANVVPVPATVAPTTTTTTTKTPSATGGEVEAAAAAGKEKDENADEAVVYGLIYNLSPSAESILDVYEGHGEADNPDPTANPRQDERRRRPFLQGDWAYNKHYLRLTVTKWLDRSQSPAPSETLKLESDVVAGDDARGDEVTVTALVYVDELRVEEARPKVEYVARMNRAIDQGCGVGVPADWVETVMRRFIPAQY